MRRTGLIVSTIALAAMLNLLIFSWSIDVAAETANVPSLIISQLKITSSNGQFITLYNSTNTTLDMSKFQLEYFNHFDLTKATSSRLISLSGTVPPHGYYMVNDSAMLLCYQLTINSVSLGLSSTSGMVEVLAFNQTNPGLGATPILQDYVGWSKTVATGAQILPSNTSAFLNRQPLDSKNNPNISSPGSGSWQTVQPDTADPCKLITGTSAPVLSGLSQLLPPTEPPASILDNLPDESDSAPTAVLPASDIGLMAPQITELLPNPVSTGNDSTDEYIELYNANIVSFDLTGFALQTGLKTPKTYKFPAGTAIPAKSFVAFYSETTSLSLSNTGSQAKLLDPFDNSISASDVYANAKDGQAWALAKGKWYWTTTPTPNAANVIKQPISAKKSKASSKSKSAKSSSNIPKSAKTNSSSTSNSFNDKSSSTPIHVWTLALIGGGAILYGLYEYRADLANRIYQLRQYFKVGRSSRSET